MPAQEGHIRTLSSRILLATDLSDLEQILLVAIDYALRCKAVLKLVHMLPGLNTPDGTLYRAVHADEERWREHAEKALEDAAEKGRNAGLQCTWTMHSGRVDQTIIQMVRGWEQTGLSSARTGLKSFAKNCLVQSLSRFFVRWTFPFSRLVPPSGAAARILP